MGCQDEATVLVDPCLTRGESCSAWPFEMGRHLRGLGVLARSPPLAIATDGADGALRDERRLHAVRTRRQRLLGLRFTGNRTAAERLNGLDRLIPVRAPLRVDGPLHVRLTPFGGEADPALRHAPSSRSARVGALARPQRRQRLRDDLRERWVGFGHGRRDAGHPW
jgi:hypothetical protein